MQWSMALSSYSVVPRPSRWSHTSCCRRRWWWWTCLYCRLAAGSWPFVSVTMLAAAAASSCCIQCSKFHRGGCVCPTKRAKPLFQLWGTAVMHQKPLLWHAARLCKEAEQHPPKSLALMAGRLESIVANILPVTLSVPAGRERYLSSLLRQREPVSGVPPSAVRILCRKPDSFKCILTYIHTYIHTYIKLY